MADAIPPYDALAWPDTEEGWGAHLRYLGKHADPDEDYRMEFGPFLVELGAATYSVMIPLGLKEMRQFEGEAGKALTNLVHTLTQHGREIERAKRNP